MKIIVGIAVVIGTLMLLCSTPAGQKVRDSFNERQQQNCAEPGRDWC